MTRSAELHGFPRWVFAARWLAAALAVGMITMAGPGTVGAAGARSIGLRSGEPFHWAGRVAAGKTLEIKGINGGIHATLATGNEVVVDARKTGRKSDPNQVKIEVAEHDEGVTICARYPRPSGELNECGRGQSVRNNDVNVEFEVALPAGVKLSASTVNGEIKVNRIQSDVEVETVNGSVLLSTTGRGEARTVNGSIKARLGTLGAGDLEFATVNGEIELEMPEGLDADVNASTVNGDIASDFPLTVKGRFGPRRLHGTLGKGGRELKLETVNGGIHLRSI